MDGIFSRIDSLIDEYESKMVEDTIKLVNIKSVRSEPIPGAPFGEGSRKVLDTVLRMGKENGFFCRDYGCGVVSVSLYEGEPDVGVWLHGDVVPEGDNWSFEPYNAVVHNGCIIGRGAADNKGEVAAIFNLFVIFKKLGIKLGFNPAMYVGSCEETGMSDISGLSGNDDAKGFINICKAPKLSLVPDGGFPVGYGGKGGMNFEIKSKNALCGFTFTAGLPDSPGTASAVFESGNAVPEKLAGCDISKGEKTEISAYVSPVHTSHPSPDGNMITKLTAALLGGVEMCGSDRKILELLNKVSVDINGEYMGLVTENEILGKLTVTPVRVLCEDGFVTVRFNSRYPTGITFEEAMQKVSAFAQENGFELKDGTKGVEPYLLDRDSEIVKFLCDTANSVTGENGKPFVMSGGTYAHKLPNAYVYGTGANVPPPDFEKGQGCCHGRDEAASIQRLKRLMRVYGRTFIKLDGRI